MPLMGLRPGWLRGGGGGGGISLMSSCYGWDEASFPRGTNSDVSGIADWESPGDYRFIYGSSVHATGVCSPGIGHIDLSICTVHRVA
jgi:hypothetical protein